jgi:hypothetical protein
MLYSCTKQISLEDLLYKNGLYLYHDKPFSGEAIYQNKANRIRTTTNFHEGIPKGKWESYGNQNEIIQSGIFEPLSINLSLEKIYRVQKSTFIEGDYKFSNYIVVVKDSISEKDKNFISEELKKTFHNDTIKVSFSSMEISLDK